MMLGVMLGIGVFLRSDVKEAETDARFGQGASYLPCLPKIWRPSSAVAHSEGGMLDRGSTVYQISPWKPSYDFRVVRILFFVASVLLCTAATAQQVSRQQAESCRTNQLMDAKEIWRKFTSNDEATEFARQKFLALWRGRVHKMAIVPEFLCTC
jgi:hypothetical protein